MVLHSERVRDRISSISLGQSSPSTVVPIQDHYLDDDRHDLELDIRTWDVGSCGTMGNGVFHCSTPFALFEENIKIGAV